MTLALGLRQGEVLGLRWSDVDLEKQTLRVRTALQWLRGDEPKLVEPKTRQSRRTLPVGCGKSICYSSPGRALAEEVNRNWPNLGLWYASLLLT